MQDTKDDFDVVFDLLCDVTDGKISEAQFREKMKTLGFSDSDVDEYLAPPV